MIAASRPASGSVWRNPLEVLTSGWANRHLILRLARREIEARYRGSILGLAWALVIPLMLLGVYTFIFSVVFGARWELPVDGKGQFALVLFAGLIMFNIFGECVNRAPALMRENVSYITKVVFPLECLVWVALTVAMFNALVSTAALLLGYLVLLGPPPVTLLAWPLLLVPLVLMTLGVAWLLASLGVYIRDLQQFVPVLTTVLLFMTPIFYPTERLPDALKAFVRLSPLAMSVEETRSLLFRRAWPDWGALLAYTALAWLVGWLGYMWFAKTRKGFADVV